MKQHIVRALLITVVLLCLTGGGQLFADETTMSLESRLVQDFSKPDAQNWFAIGSKFSTGDFPHYGFISGGPQAVLGSDPQAAKDAKSLGIAMLFDRKEYNWVDIIPGTKDKPTEIPLPGRVKMIDMWVWSGDFDYYLEAYVRDYKGIVYTIPMGDLSFAGWKDLRINIPDSVPQAKTYLPRKQSLTLVKFRIWTRPTEAVVVPGLPTDATDLDKAVKFYFYDIKVLTDTFETLFDGDTLTNPDVYKDALTNSAAKK
ncbi:MAG TPA: flagellar filament outer layer protein FlaA [Rectinemataceae bacterium]|nr:flagellar filament outer layer protein FlaA [Rectinemataceae bacterium]